MFAYHLYSHAPSFAMMADASKPPKSVRKPAAAAAHPSHKDIPMAEVFEPAAVQSAMTATKAGANLAKAYDELEMQNRIDEALAAHNTRTEAILGCEDAKGRDDLAKFLAFGTKLDVDAAKAALAKAPKPQETAANPFELAMAASRNPQVGPDGQSDPGEYKHGTMAAKMRAQLNLPSN